MGLSCPCGKKIEPTTATFYQTAIFDTEGKIIGGICIHGYRFGDWENTIKERNEK